MSIVVRDVREHELDSVLALNNAAGPAILPLDAARLRHFFDSAEYFRVAERDGTLAGFLIGIGADSDHDSSNFRWFRDRYPDFFYIDRIVVASRRRGGGVGRAFYADAQSYAELRYPQLACEVFLEGGNDPALLFHGSFGFREVGQHVMEEAGVRAAMLMKPLCSYAWVRETYGDALPEASWLTRPRVPVRRAPAEPAHAQAAQSQAAQAATPRPTGDRPVSVAVDYEQAGELKIGQVGIANLRIRTLDVERLSEEMRSRVQRAPNMFGRAAVVIDFGGLSQTPDAATAQALLDGLRAAGVLPVALAYGTSETDRLAQALGLPLLAKFRAGYERGEGEPAAAAPAVAAVRREPAAALAAAEPARASRPGTAAATAIAPTSVGLIQSAPVRSGQQIYADHRDLTVLTTVGAGAEVIADGSVHIYGPLRGRALAGAQGDTKARIFCREFHAELVAIAGHYKVLEDIPKDLRGKAVQIWLEDEQIRIAALD